LLNFNTENTNKPKGHKIDLVTIFTIIITNIVTLSGSFLAFQTNKEQSQTNFVQTTLNQVQKQSKEIIELRGLLLAAQINIIELESQVRDNVDEEELFNDFLNDLPFPAVIKKYDEKSDKFIIEMINQRYTSDFGYTENRYLGKSYYEIHPPEIAEMYKNIGLKVLRTRTPIVSEKDIITNAGVKKHLYVYTFPIYVKGSGSTLMIGQVAIDAEEISSVSSTIMK